MHLARGAGEVAAEQRDFEPEPDEALEILLQMNFGPAGLGVFLILPVYDQ
jgi:hypothetical protein